MGQESYVNIVWGPRAKPRPPATLFNPAAPGGLVPISSVKNITDYLPLEVCTSFWYDLTSGIRTTNLVRKVDRLTQSHR